MGEGDAGFGRRWRRAPRVGSTGARFPRDVEARYDQADDDPADAEHAADAEIPDARTEDADGLLGRTGARFNSRARRSRRETERAAAEDAALPPQTRSPADPAQPLGDDAPTHPFFLDITPPPESTRTTVRPYVRTRGRTRTRAELRLETLVSVPSPRPPLDDPEHRAIGDLCGGPRSVAEVAALLSVPLGVARVLIDDMATEGLLTVHPIATPEVDGAAQASVRPPLALMERVLNGLHRL